MIWRFRVFTLFECQIVKEGDQAVSEGTIEAEVGVGLKGMLISLESTLCFGDAFAEGVRSKWIIGSESGML